MRTPRRIVVLTALLLAVVVAAQAQARTAVVTTNDGRTYRGEVLTDNETGVTLSIAGVPTPIARGDIRDVKFQLSPGEEFRQRRAELADDDLEGRYKLARWLFEAKAYEIASVELADMRKQFPDEGRVEQLAELVNARLKIQRAAEQEKNNPPAPKPDPPKPQMPGNSDPLPVDVNPEKAEKLTDEQINAIKVYEIDFDSRPPPQVFFERDVIAQFINEYQDQSADLRGLNNQRRFRTVPGAEQLRFMMSLRAREYYPLADVRNDPPAMMNFKRFVHRQYVINFCATTDCHGEKPNGGLRLFQDRPTSDATVYTNFYILHRWNRGEGFMIDRERPRDSYLYQYGLPQADAVMRHPDVPGLTPRIRSRNEPVAEALVDWINLLYKPTPDYPIDYTPPGSKAIEQQPPQPAAP